MKYFKNQPTRSESGFTIVEIMVIILIIGILSTVLVLTYSGVEIRQKNTARINDIKLIQGSLESFYAQSGFYPTLAEMNNPVWTTANLKSLDPGELQDPNAKANVARFASEPKPNQFSYQPSATNSNTACDNKTIACGQYVLTATLGGNSGTFVEKSLN